ncbi:MAG: PilZ domain-containing protein [Desulfobulbaceae bacterium]|nr:PilZ domain-containing protein [Desulfobulbaceae bacterium]
MTHTEPPPSLKPTMTERRRHQRFKAPEKTLAITPNIIGQIIDISAGGCELKYIDNNGHLPTEGVMDILANDAGFYLEEVPIAMAWQDQPENSALSTIMIRKVGLSFASLTPAQKERIDFFIKNHTLGIA